MFAIISERLSSLGFGYLYSNRWMSAGAQFCYLCYDTGVMFLILGLQTPILWGISDYSHRATTRDRCQNAYNVTLK